MTVLAIMWCYNEADIIFWSVTHAISQGLRVHVIDNWSTDDSWSILGQLQNKHPQLTLSRWPRSGPVQGVSWAEMLQHTANVAAASGADWCLHYDADEIRRSDRPEENLLDAIQRIDAAGFNAIDHRVEIFAQRIGFNGSQNPETYLTEQIFGDHVDHRAGQVKCWKQQPGHAVDLASSGGHTVAFPGIKIAPEKLVLKHYPLRSPEQAEAKRKSRDARWSQSEKNNAWHVQYNGLGMTIVTLSRFPAIFQSLKDSVDIYEPAARKILVTSGSFLNECDPRDFCPGWEVVVGVEPFVFSRNANLGLLAAGPDRDVLLINDDCVLKSPITPQLRMIFEKHECGILSPVIRGDVGNLLQREGMKHEECYESQERLAFVCVYLPASTRKTIGLLDERFIGYGGDDDDYSLRVQQAGLKLCVTASAVVEHGRDGRGSSSSFLKLMSSDERDRSMNEMRMRLREKHKKTGLFVDTGKNWRT